MAWALSLCFRWLFFSTVKATGFAMITCSFSVASQVHKFWACHKFRQEKHIIQVIIVSYCDGFQIPLFKKAQKKLCVGVFIFILLFNKWQIIQHGHEYVICHKFCSGILGLRHQETWPSSLCRLDIHFF